MNVNSHGIAARIKSKNECYRFQNRINRTNETGTRKKNKKFKISEIQF